MSAAPRIPGTGNIYQLCIAKSVPRAYGEYSNGTWWATMMGICNNN